VKNAKITFRTSIFTNFCTLSGKDALRNQEFDGKRRSKTGRGKIIKSGGSDPTFRAFTRPKGVCGRSRPLRAFNRARDFSVARNDFDSRRKGQPPCH